MSANNEKAYDEARTSAWKAYDEARTSARKVYNEARASARKVYEEARTAAWKVYDETTTSAEKVDDETITPAWKVFEEAMASAQKVYDVAEASAWKVYNEAMAPAKKVYDEAISALHAKECSKEEGERMTEMDRHEREGGRCPDCGQIAEYRTCDQCGASAWIIDCGHYPQPRPIASGRADGSDPHHTYCEDCAAEACNEDMERGQRRTVKSTDRKGDVM